MSAPMAVGWHPTAQGGWPVFAGNTAYGWQPPASPGWSPAFVPGQYGWPAGSDNRVVTKASEARVDGQQYAEMFQLLEIQTSEHQEFGWIAERALTSQLPPRWSCYTDPQSGRAYYMDQDTQATTWEHPFLPYIRRIIEIGRMYFQEASETFFEDHRGLLWEEHKAELESWHGPMSNPSGQPYFVNSISGQQTVFDPRECVQCIHELECELLTGLEQVLPKPGPNTPGRHWGSSSPWLTSTGAEVLTIESPNATLDSPKTARPQTSRPPTGYEQGVFTQTAAAMEHKTTFSQMHEIVERVLYTRNDEEEAQRLRLKRKVDARQKRKLQNNGGNQQHKPVLAENG